MIPRKCGPMLFSLILSGLMSLLVSGISTIRVSGLASNFANMGIRAWLTAWIFAFPVVLVVAPLARSCVEQLTARPWSCYRFCLIYLAGAPLWGDARHLRGQLGARCLRP
jgi:hypothetical protein